MTIFGSDYRVHKMRLLLLFLLTGFASFMVQAQSSVPLKCYKLYLKGQEHLRKKQYDKATQALERSIRCHPQYLEAYDALSDLYLMTGAYQAASETLNKASSVCTACRQSYALKLARALCRVRLYDQAEQALNKWGTAPEDNSASGTEYQLLRKNIQFGRYLAGRPETHTPVNMGARINTGFDEYFPSISPDDSTLIFTHRTNGMDEDFFLARRDSCGGWFLARDMGAPPNSMQQEGAQMRSADGRYLFFMRCGNRSHNGWEGGGCDLYFSYTQPGEWSQPVPFGATINTPAFEGMPSLSPDNQVLYFVSDREGGYGGKDIWYSRFEQGLWQIPENAGPEINTAFDDTAPYIAADNQTLYFTSNGHPGLGGNDIFYSKKDSAGRWQRPENMGYPFNSPYEDVSLVVSANGQKAYFASDRPGGIGGMDLYEVNLHEAARPEPYTFVYGVVYDSIGRSMLPYATIEFYKAGTNELLYQFMGNRGDASFMGAVALEQEMYMKVFRNGFLTHEDTLYFDEVRTAAPDTLSVALLPFDYKPVLYDTLLTTLCYAKDEADLTDSMKEELSKLLQPFIGKRFVEFVVKGVVTNSGNPATATNLSYTRAEHITELLLTMGVDAFYIHTYGGGQATMEGGQADTSLPVVYPGVELIIRKP